MFRIAEDVDLPADAVTQTFAFLARRGAGKTYSAGVFAEALLDGAAQVVVVDPVGVWFGLRLDTHGNAAGIPIAVFGGERGDIPLEPTAGAVVAQLVAEQRLSVVLDISEFSIADQRRFVTDFAEALFQLKKKNRTPVHIVFEEAQEFFPQMVDAGSARMVGAVLRLWKIGRNFGIGGTLISQRPQAINKGALNLTEVLVTGQLTGPQERKTIAGWVNDQGMDAAALAELPRLPVGTVYLWSPQWLAQFVKTRFLKKRTFDASATPKAGDVAARAELAPIDLAKVREAMVASIEAAKEHDPKALRAEVARLRLQLTAMDAEIPHRRDLADERNHWREEFHSADRALKDLGKGLDGVTVEEVRRLRAMELHFDKVIGTVDAYRAEGGGRWARTDAQIDGQPITGMRPPNTQEIEDLKHAPRISDFQVNPDGHTSYRVTAPSGEKLEATYRRAATGGDTSIGKCGREILTALATRHPSPLSKTQVATLAGYAPGGGGFANAIGDLKGRGLIERDGDSFAITPAGLKAAPAAERPRSPAELVDYWCSKLPGRARDMLRLLARSRKPLTKEEIAADVGMDASGGGFNNYLGALRSNALIQKTRGGFEAASSLVVR